MYVWAVYHEDSSDWPVLFDTEEKAKKNRDAMAQPDHMDAGSWKVIRIKVN